MISVREMLELGVGASTATDWLGSKTMIAKVNAQGLLITPEMLHGAAEVEIHEEPGRIVILLDPANDPILQLGTNPVRIDVDDASLNLDK